MEKIPNYSLLKVHLHISEEHISGMSGHRPHEEQPSNASIWGLQKCRLLFAAESTGRGECGRAEAEPGK